MATVNNKQYWNQNKEKWKWKEKLKENNKNINVYIVGGEEASHWAGVPAPDATEYMKQNLKKFNLII